MRSGGQDRSSKEQGHGECVLLGMLDRDIAHEYNQWKTIKLPHIAQLRRPVRYPMRPLSRFFEDDIARPPAHSCPVPDILVPLSRPLAQSVPPSLPAEVHASIEVGLQFAETPSSAAFFASPEEYDNVDPDPVPAHARFCTVTDPMEGVGGLMRSWEEAEPSSRPVLMKALPNLLDLADQIVSHIASDLQQRYALPSAKQCSDMQSTMDHLLDGLAVLQERHGRQTAQPRSADGITQVDSGVFALFEGCKLVPVTEALQGLDLVAEASELETEFWMCYECGRPTSEDYEQHLWEKHGKRVDPGYPAPPLTTEVVLQLLEQRRLPATTAYTLESPIYRKANQAMRQFQKNRAGFDVWRPFAYSLHQELQQLPRFEGDVYRAIDFRVDRGLYLRGNVVTWNQPSSASEDPVSQGSF